MPSEPGWGAEIYKQTDTGALKTHELGPAAAAKKH